MTLSPLLLLLPTLASPPMDDPLSIDVGDGRARVQLGDELVTEFVWEDTARPYLYPLHAAGGAALTRGFPMDPQPHEAHDHPHHQSAWFAHGDVDGFDFWHGRGHQERIELERIERAAVLEDGRGELVASLAWRVGEGDAQRTLLRERRSMRFSADESARTIEFELRLTPAGDEPVVFGDTKEGSFALRLTPSLRLSGEVAAGSALNSEGESGGAVWGKRAAWVAYSGPVEGETYTVLVVESRRNFRHPTWWHARPYGLFAANPFGIHDFEGGEDGRGDHRLEPGEELVLRYAVVLLNGAPEATALDALAEEMGA